MADLRRNLRQARRAHSERTLGELLTDVYLVLFLAVLYGGSAAVSIKRHLKQPLDAPVGTESTRFWLLLVLLVVAGAFAWRGLRMVGPLITTPPAQAWVVSTPIDRADWLRAPLIGPVGVLGDRRRGGGRAGRLGRTDDRVRSGPRWPALAWASSWPAWPC